MAGFVDKLILFSETLVIALWYYRDPRVMAAYVVICLALKMFLHRPSYDGPTGVEYLNPLDFEQKVLKRPRSKKEKNRWLVFFTLNRTWHTECADLDYLLANISVEGFRDVRFGKIDVGRFPALAKKHGINADDVATSKQIPSLVLFEGGAEVKRLPPVRPTGEVSRVRFEREGIVKVFGLDK